MTDAEYEHFLAEGPTNDHEAYALEAEIQTNLKHFEETIRLLDQDIGDLQAQRRAMVKEGQQLTKRACEIFPSWSS